MIRPICIAVALALVLVVPATADTLEISGTVQQNYQNFLDKVKEGDNAAFAVTEDGMASYWLHCRGCALTNLTTETIEKCQQNTGRPCKLAAVNTDTRASLQAVPDAVDAPAGSKPMSGAELTARIVGSTVKGEYLNRAQWAEFYDESGEIRGRDLSGAYTIRYRIEGDKICYDYPGSDQDWCGQLTESGGEVRFLRDGKMLAFIRGAIIEPGNPEGL